MRPMIAWSGMLLTGLLLLLSACGSVPAESDSTVQGTITLNGSSALYPLMGHAAAVFEEQNPNIRMDVVGSRSGLGRELVCTGAIDIGTSDVPLSEDEKAKWDCGDAVEVPVATQAFAPVANPQGPGSITSLTKDQLVAIFSGVIINWSEVGGEDVPIVLVNRVPGSGTRDNMAKYLFDGDDMRFAASALEGENAQIVNAVQDTPGVISYLGSGYLQNPGMLVLGIDGVAFTSDTARSGEWPIVSQGYMITKGEGSPAVQAFRDLLTDPEFQSSETVMQLGYLPVTSE